MTMNVLPADPQAEAGSLRELLPQRRLAELADGRLRDLVDELERVRQPELGEVRGEELAQLVGRRRLALAADADGQRPLVPLLVRDRDHGRLGDRRVRHQRVLEVDRRDPLAAGLDHVLRAVLDHHVALGVERGDVAGLEPAVVGPALGLLGRLVVAGRDPGAAHLELAHRLAVPGDLLAVVADRAQLDERERQPLHRDDVELGLLVGVAELADVVGGGRERGGLGHPPAVHDRLAVALPEAGDHRARRGRAADEHVLELLEVPAVGLRVEHAEDPHPDRRHAGRDRDALLLEVVEQRLGIEERAGEDDLRPDHQAGVGVAPGVGVEHRHDRQQRLLLGHVQAERRDERLAERVQDGRAVRVEDALRHPGRAARVAHRRGVVLVELRVLVVVRVGAGEQLLVGVLDDEDVLDLRLVGELLPERQQRALSTIRALSPACVAM